MSPLIAIFLLAFGASPDTEATTLGWHAPELRSKGVASPENPGFRSQLKEVPPDSPLAAPKGTRAQPAESHYPDVTEVAEWKFESTGDEEIYRLPPGWTQRHGPGFPRYVQVRVDDERPPPGGRCLRVELNGGAASAFGPTIALEPGVNYVLDGLIKTSDLEHDAAWLSLTFLDSRRQKLTSPTSAPISGTSGWQKVRVGPLTPPAGASSMVVGIHISPLSEVEDLHGSAAFGALWLGRVPRVVLTARPADDSSPRSASKHILDGSAQNSIRGADDASFRVFARGKPIEVACLTTGFNAGSTVPKYEVRLTLENDAGRKLTQHAETIGTIFAHTTSTATVAKSRGAEAPIDASTATSARTTWQIPIESVGYYRISAKLSRSRRVK